MLIQKQPVLSWLLDPSDNECSSKVGVPIIPDRAHYEYLCGGFKILSDIRNQNNPEWGLPELLMPSFEEAMRKSAESFSKIDHQLFQEFYRDDVCGILILKNLGTLVYGFGENKLHVWWFWTSYGLSHLLMYFYAESTDNNLRNIYTLPGLHLDKQLFAGLTESEREHIYAKLTDEIMVYLAVKKYGKVETVIVPPGRSVRFDYEAKGYDKKNKIRNESGQEVVVMDSRWFRKIINDNDIFVRAYFRLQNKKNAKGEWYKELIVVKSHIRHGYHRDAKVEGSSFTD